MTLLLFLVPVHFFSFLPHIFLVIENQTSFSTNRHENCKHDNLCRPTVQYSALCCIPGRDATCRSTLLAHWHFDPREQSEGLITLPERLWKITNIRDENLRNCWGRRGSKEFKSDIARQELSSLFQRVFPCKNRFRYSRKRFFTSENEPSEVSRKWGGPN